MSFLVSIYAPFLYAYDSYDEGIETNSAVVFMYHRFGESKYPSTNITLEQFEFHLDYLNKNNYNVWKLSKIVKHLIAKKPLPPKTVAITIDDAYISTYIHAYPRLKKLNFPFTVFVHINPVDKKYGDFMSWDQMREMKKYGAEFANHSLNHDHLIENESMSKERIAKDIQEAQKRLDEELGKNAEDEPKLFSYPYGEYTLKIASLVEDLGYVGVSQTSGPIGMQSDLKELTRYAMSEVYADPKGFVTKLNTLPMPIDSVYPKEHLVYQQNPPILQIKLVKELKDMACYSSVGERLKLEWISKNELKVYSKKILKPPRDRYTCTAKAKNDRYYWYSHLWIIQD